MPLNGRVVLITGAARGLGREFTRGFLKQGAKVIATARNWKPSGVSGDELDFLAEIRDNPDVLTQIMDITVDSDVRRVYEAAIARFGKIDVIINNAAMRPRDLYPPTGNIPIIQTEVSDWFRMFDANVFGTFRVTKAFAQSMLEQGRGSIINVCSDGRNGITLEGPYQPSKAAEIELTRFLAHELKPNNIAANVLMPGFTRTTGSDEQNAARAELQTRAEPGRPFLTRRLRPESAVPLALFLAEQDGSGVTGQILNVLRWNEEHGLGGFETWGYGPDVEAARKAGTL